jgi:hypothetical protein
MVGEIVVSHLYGIVDRHDWFVKWQDSMCTEWKISRNSWYVSRMVSEMVGELMCKMEC